MAKDIMVRGLSDSVEQAFEAKFAGKLLAGATSPRLNALRALIGFFSLEVDLSAAAYELWLRSLQIANQRGEAWLRDVEKLRETYESEQEELAQALKDGFSALACANRLSNVLYYCVQIYAQDGNRPRFLKQCQKQCDTMNIPLPVGFQLANAKYGSRGARAEANLTKDVPAEEQAMQRVLDEFSSVSKTDTKTT